MLIFLKHKANAVSITKTQVDKGTKTNKMKSLFVQIFSLRFITGQTMPWTVATTQLQVNIRHNVQKLWLLQYSAQVS